MKETQTLEFIEDESENFINHLIKQDPDVKGSVRIDVRHDNTYDITVHKGSDVEVNKLKSVTKEKMLELLEKRL